jgi:nitronate monooxygenase
MNPTVQYPSLSNYGPLVIGDKTIPLPLIQGGMGVGISLAGLASAVANAGGVGVISAACVNGTPRYAGKNLSSSEALRQEIRLARSLSDGALGVNIMVALRDFEVLCRATAEEGADFIFAGAGLPLKMPEFIPASSNIKLIPIISSAKAAALICRWWKEKHNRYPDAFILEGPLAGGHLGFKPEQISDPAYQLENLLVEVLRVTRQLKESAGVEIPVIAAGGIYSGEDIYRLLSLGAAGIQMATRFVGTHECDAPLSFKQAYLNCKPEDLEIINSPVGMPGRAIANPFVRSVSEGEKHPKTCHFHCIITCQRDQSPYCIADALLLSLSGDANEGLVFAGANAWKVSELISVPQLMTNLDRELAQAKNNSVLSAERMQIA